MFIPIYNLAKFRNPTDLPKIAEVINNSDPKGLGRIKVKLQGLYDPEDPQGTNLPWIRKMSSEMGISVDERNIPFVGDKVELVWPYDNKHAFYRGIPYGQINNREDFQYDWGWVMPSFALLINKSSGAFQIRNNHCTVNVNEEGKIDIHTDSDTNISTEGNTNINSKGTTDLLSEGNLTINSKSNTNITTTGITNIDSTGIATLKGSSVNITGSNINIGNNTTIDGKSFLGHIHSNGNLGEPTGGVL